MMDTDATSEGGGRLGPFELGELLGKGGMGAVYRARHADTGTAVAIKVLRSNLIRFPRQRRNFRREIQALAQLNHPGIAAILDYGKVDARAARRGPPALEEGAPWFAMESVDGPAMHGVSHAWPWPKLRRLLLLLFDALAHAHARSIIHRDLTPANILIVDDGPDWRIKVVDFGIAGLLDPNLTDGSDLEAPEAVAGTPRYMAPEQITGRRRDQGPWTDLYAVGCLVWHAVCGDPPLEGDDTQEILDAHVRGDLPEFDPRYDVPDGLEGWLRSLLETSIDRRLRRAADAAWQLRQLGDPGGDGTDPGSDALAFDATSSLRTLTQQTAPTRDMNAPAQRDEATSPSDGRVGPDAGRIDRPPIPSDWRRTSPPAAAAPLPKAGLQLFGLREVPIVGRQPERETLWDRLREVADGGGPALVTLAGHSGTGKTRLAQWLCRRARELGAATTLRAYHAPTAGPAEGLRGMIRHRFRTGGLERQEVFDRLLERLPPLPDDENMRAVDARALTELLRPSTEASASISGPRYQFSSRSQLYALVRRLFARLASTRPLLVWFDDIQWGPEAAGLLRNLFDASETIPGLLVVTTVRSDLLADAPRVRRRLDAVHRADSATRIDLRPLAPADHRMLIDRLLHLTPEFAETLADRTEGHPLFAIQLLRDWTARDRLTATERGFRPPPEATDELPDDIHRLWLDRLGRIVDAFPASRAEDVRTSLQLAAALGREVDTDEWRALCQPPGTADLQPRLTDLLVEHGLAEPTDIGWAFVHGLLVESLERQAREQERWADHHRRCARMLARTADDNPQRTAVRRANHWERAGDTTRALDPLMEAIDRLAKIGSPERRLELLERREALLDDLGLPDDAPRRLANDVESAKSALQLHTSPEEALEAALDAHRRAEEAAIPVLVARALGVAAMASARMGAYEDACTYSGRAVTAARAADDDDALASMLISAGWTRFLNGSLDDAETCYAEARRIAAAAGNTFREMHAKRGLASVAYSKGDFSKASMLFEDLLDQSRAAGYRWLEANTLNGLGELARFGGNAERARTLYQRYLTLNRELNFPKDVASAHINLGQVALLARRFDEAADQLDEAETKFDELEQTASMANLIRLGRLAGAAGTARWTDFDRHLEPYADGWRADAQLIRDHPWLVEMAGDYADEQGESERSRRAWRLARRLWERLDDGDAAARVATKLDGDAG